MTTMTKDSLTRDPLPSYFKFENNSKVNGEQIKKDKYRDAMTCLMAGDFYTNGKCTSQDYLNALEWYLKGVKLDHKYSCYRIGELFEKGHGVTMNQVTALEWYYKHSKFSFDVKRLIKNGVDKTNIITERPLAVLIKEVESLLKNDNDEKAKEKKLESEIQGLKQKEKKSTREHQLMHTKMELLETEHSDVKAEMLLLEIENKKLKQRIQLFEKHFQQLCHHCKKEGFQNLFESPDVCHNSVDRNVKINDNKNCGIPNGHDSSNDLCYDSDDQINVNYR